MEEVRPLNHPSYRDCFAQLERAANDGGCTTLIAYQLYDSYLKEHSLDPTVYFSMAITSGGFKRNEQLAISEVIERNALFGTEATQAFLQQFPQFDETDIVLPSDLGKMKGWTQGDYLTFWFHVISGIDAETAEKIEDTIHHSGALASAGFTELSLPEKTRWSAYENLVNTYLSALDHQSCANQPYAHNMQAVVMVLDGQMSLGARAEELFARKCGIPPQFQPLDASLRSKLSEIYLQMTDELSGLGATALGTTWNTVPHLSFAGLSQGSIETGPFVRRMFRKTGLMNALLSKEFYAEAPERRPKRHQGHTPLAGKRA